ncbi:MAG: hypothetical protein GY833_22770 [Aestuariibacter sp.]|nr:hypothetical protein [Aestuariibacter sp.]
MTTFNTATALLNKRCDYIEERLSHHSELVGKAPEGKQYKHFVLQGLMSLAYYAPTTTSLDTLNDNARHTSVCTISDMHLSELAVFETEDKLVDQPVNLQDLRTYGFNLSDYPSLGVMGTNFRSSSLFNVISEAYRLTYGLPYGHSSTNVYTAHYKGRELIPVDEEASWDAQAENLLYQARSFPIKDLLGTQHIISADGKAGALSLRRAGFPVAQFQANTYGHDVVPATIPTSTDMNPIRFDDLSSMTVTRHCPSVVLVTIECPDDVDSLINSSESGDVNLTYYFKHIAVPHWVGHSNGFKQSMLEDATEGQPFESSHLYDPAMVTHFSDHLTSAFIHGRRDDPAQNYGDLVIYTPSDSSLASTEPLALGDARSFKQDDKPFILAAETNATAFYEGATAMTMFTNNTGQWAQVKASYSNLSFKTAEKVTVKGLRIANGGPAHKWGRRVTLYTKSPDDPSGLTDSSPWVYHEVVGYAAQQDILEVMFSSPAPRTNLFRVVFQGSSESRYHSLQYVGLITDDAT